MFNITRQVCIIILPQKRRNRDPPVSRVSTSRRDIADPVTQLTVSFSRRVPGEAGGSGAPPRQPLRLSGTHPCWMLASNKASRHILSSVRLSPVRNMCTYHVGILALVSTSRAVSTRIRRRPHSAECGTATYRTDPSVPVSLTESSEVLAGSVCHSQLIPDGISPFPTSLPGHSSLYQERCPSPVCAHTKLPHKS
jgi:hypothetical protein